MGEGKSGRKIGRKKENSDQEKMLPLQGSLYWSYSIVMPFGFDKALCPFGGKRLCEGTTYLSRCNPLYQFWGNYLYHLLTGRRDCLFTLTGGEKPTKALIL